MHAFLVKYDEVILLGSLALVIILALAGYLLLNRTSQEEDGSQAPTPSPGIDQQSPLPTRQRSLCGITRASLDKFLLWVGTVLALLISWYYIGWLWTVVLTIAVVAIVLCFAGKRFAAMIFVAISLILIGAGELAAWGYSSYEKKSANTASTTGDSTKPSPTGQKAAADLTAVPSYADTGNGVVQSTTTENAAAQAASGLGAATVAVTAAAINPTSDDQGCIDDPSGGKISYDANGIEKPLVSPHPNQQPCGRQAHNDASAPLPPVRRDESNDIKPITGDQGNDLRVRMWPSCSRADADEVVCTGYIATRLLESERVELGNIDDGKFGEGEPQIDFKASTWNTNLHFEGTTGPVSTLIPMTESRFTFYFKVGTNRVNVAAFTIKYFTNHWHTAVFADVPIT